MFGIASSEHRTQFKFCDLRAACGSAADGVTFRFVFAICRKEKERKQKKKRIRKGNPFAHNLSQNFVAFGDNILINCGNTKEVANYIDKFDNFCMCKK